MSDQTLDPRDFGGYFDGQPHLVRDRFATLAGQAWLTDRPECVREV